jgi:hypothetical protein
LALIPALCKRVPMDKAYLYERRVGAVTSAVAPGQRQQKREMIDFDGIG